MDNGTLIIVFIGIFIVVTGITLDRNLERKKEAN